VTAEGKGGQLARQAAMLGELEAFRLYLDDRKRWREGLTTGQMPDATHSEQDAADAIRQACGIRSRAELDHNEMPGVMFKRIVSGFGRWKRRAGL